jgi:diguanylate cyclase (GGDEF)-like protein/PAS domain S-box-containing protein
MAEDPTGQRLAVGLVVVRRGRVAWFDERARALVEPHGGSWLDPAGPCRVIDAVPAGSVRFPMIWASPLTGPRRWEVTSTVVPEPPPGTHYLIHDRGDGDRADSRIEAAAPHWRLDRLEALAGMGSWELDVVEGRIEWSTALLAMYGLPADSPVDFGSFRAMVQPDDLVTMDRALAEGMASGEPFGYVHRIRTSDAAERVLECRCEVAIDADGHPTRVLGVVRDITEEHRALTELTYLAGHDPLTGVANRRGITVQLAERAAAPAGATLLLIDIDHFKQVNDRHGHAVGDRVIRHIADTLAAHLEGGALLGRLGGDEFAVVLPSRDPDGGIALGERLCAAVAGRPVVDDGATLRLSLSIGVAAVTPGHDAETTLAFADLALYAAKNAGRGRAVLHAGEQRRTRGRAARPV